MVYFRNIDNEYFFRNFWNKKPFQFRAGVHAELELSHLHNVVQSGIDYPNLRVLERGGALNPLFYTKSSTKELSHEIDFDKFNGLDLNGKTVKLQGAFENFGDIGHLKNLFCKFFPDFKVSLNSYFSFGQSKGATPHYDFYHIFAHQIAGKKSWKIGPIIDTNPVYGLCQNSIPDSLEYEYFETVPGDVIYIPPGAVHDVSADSNSIHLAIGLNGQRVYECIQQCIKDITILNSSLRADFSPSFLSYEALNIQDFDKLFSLVKNEFIKKYYE
ncbi:hypothetical protein H5202_15800 [Shewanella sp. SG41-4]|uniref:JmjC domain-containing protein n=1 Tax=Shewanella sp. SG41-4 TaxID=2760976 RepID=UPI001602ECFE|nr:cupin domain-containing protein [Shewanella sp. SG41-4]MBB1440111.1 hypothetical protein [Shewanella sp. SG41-4]